MAPSNRKYFSLPSSTRLSHCTSIKASSIPIPNALNIFRAGKEAINLMKKQVHKPSKTTSKGKKIELNLCMAGGPGDIKRFPNNGKAATPRTIA